MNKKELAIELNKHWLDSVEKVKDDNNEVQVFAVCSCGEWIPIPLEPIPEVGDPVFAFSEHCVDAMLKNDWIDEERLARALRKAGIDQGLTVDAGYSDLPDDDAMREEAAAIAKAYREQ